MAGSTPMTPILRLTSTRAFYCSLDYAIRRSGDREEHRESVGGGGLARRQSPHQKVVTEKAGVSRQTLHTWLARCEPRARGAGIGRIAAAREVLSEPVTEVAAASAWEIAIKTQPGGLPVLVQPAAW
jgi:hypothetical protein